MVRNIIYLPDGTEISSGIKSSLFVRIVNSGEELTIGSTCANKAEFTIFDVGGSLSVTAGQEIAVYRDDGTTRKKLGMYILQKPSRPTANTLKLVGYDRVINLEKDLTNWLDGLTDWPYTPIQLAQMVCDECGLTFVTESVPNENFPVEQFKKQGATGRMIMQWLAEICCRFCRADSDGNIEFAWYTPSNVTIRATGDRYILSGGLTYKTFQTAPIDAVQIRLADSASGALWPSVEAENPYIITGNAIINRISEGIEPYLQTIRDELSDVSYTPCEVAIPSCLDIDVGNTVTIEDRNGNEIIAYVMEKQTTGQKDIIRCNGSAKRPIQTGDYDETYQAVKELDEQLDSYGVWKRLTNNGEKQGIYYENDQLYINGAFIKVGTFQADTIKLLTGESGRLYFESWDELGAFIKAQVDTMDDYTEKSYSVIVAADPVNSSGVLEIARGRDADLFSDAVVTLVTARGIWMRYGSDEGNQPAEDWYWREWFTFGDGDKVIQGETGKSAYEIAVDNGFAGTEEEWLASLKPASGAVSVRSYGAIGNGSADDTASFQTALASERVVIVPGGTYVLSGTLTIRENCCLELSQDTVLLFTQTGANCITLLRLASLRGNHATIFVPYTFCANVINCDGGEDYGRLDSTNSTTIGNTNNAAVPPFTRWDPQWKMSRYVTDVNICKPNSNGFHYSDDGSCYGNGIYLHCDEADWPCNYMWGVSMSGVRIAGGFNCGIRIYNIGDPAKSWNHDMRIEAVIDACKIGISVENARYDRLSVTIQPRPAADGTAYAEHGIKLIDSRGIDLSSSRVWDWMTKDTDGNTINSKWEADNEYQHIAMYGDCQGLILDDYLYYAQSTYDIRNLIYTDTASNLEKMTILQEPITRWFKPVDGMPYFSNGTSQKKLATQDDLDTYFDTDVVKGFTDVLALATDTDGTIFGGVGYKSGYLDGTGKFYASSYYVTTGFIPCVPGQTLNFNDMSYKTYDGYCFVVTYDADKNKVLAYSGQNLSSGDTYYFGYSETDGGFAATIKNVVGNANVAYARFSFLKTNVGTNPMVAIDEDIKYSVEGFLADGVKVKGGNVLLYSPSGKTFQLRVSDDGAISVEPVSD